MRASNFEFEQPNHYNKSDLQIRKWVNPRKLAVSNFIKVIGDLSVDQISRQDILHFKKWWAERISKDNRSASASASAANKNFTQLKSILRSVDDNHQLKLNVEELFRCIRFTEKPSQRPPFSTAFIQETLLDMSNLIGLNAECRWFLYAMADTGARPSELVGLNPENGDIRLDVEHPYIYIRPDHKKELKTQQSERQIPLVGASLLAFQNLPSGFNHYYRNSDLLSNTLNKFLRESDLLPTTEHCVYSLRHSFEDRLTAVEPPEKVQAALMGHKYNRPRYGDGPSLKQKKKWLDKIALKVT